MTKKQYAFIPICTAVAALLTSAATAPAIAGGSTHSNGLSGFFLQPTDRVVFLGDSITALNRGTWPQGTERPNYTYCADIVSWVATQLPSYRVAFYDLAVPGDTAEGDIWPNGGPNNQGVPPNQTIDERLQSAESLNPTVVTINLGMNDGEYVDCNPADPHYNAVLYHTYTVGITHIVQSWRDWSVKNSRPLRIVVLSPEYFDNAQRVSAGWKFWWGAPSAKYNETLAAFGSWEASYIRGLHDPHVTFVDLNGPMAQANTRLPKGQSLTQEGIHPTLQGNEIIAATVLDAWNAADAKPNPAGHTVPWALHDGGSAPDVCQSLERLYRASASDAGSSRWGEKSVAWQNDLIGKIRDEFVLQQTAVMSKAPIPAWSGSEIYGAAATAP